MLRIIFNLDTNTNPANEADMSYPPSALVNTELEICFEEAAKVFNKHLEKFPGRWNYSEKATGSAYLNLVTVIYFLRMYPDNGETLPTRHMHSISRFLHGCALKFFSQEMNLLSENIVFDRATPPNRFYWEYSTGGLQMLRNYNLLGYVASTVYWSPLLEFCRESDITLSETSPATEIKISKVLKINDSKFVIPETIKPEALSASIQLIENIATSGGFGYSITSLGCKDEIKVFRRGHECDPASLSSRELSVIAGQLENSPSLMRKLIKLGVGNGSVS